MNQNSKTNYLLIGGAPNVGKTESIYRLTKDYLIEEKKFEIKKGEPEPEIISETSKVNDFMVLLEGENQNRKTISILINSGSDSTGWITKLREFEKKCNHPHILISSIRCDGYDEDSSEDFRKVFFDIMEIKQDDPNLLEVPLAKIMKNKKANIVKEKALNWYKEKVDLLLKKIIQESPFNV
jgi:hypothetical protein